MESIQESIRVLTNEHASLRRMIKSLTASKHVAKQAVDSYDTLPTSVHSDRQKKNNKMFANKNMTE
jgi:hypothetical protein